MNEELNNYVIISIIKNSQICSTCHNRIEAFDVIKDKNAKFILAMGIHTEKGNLYYHLWEVCAPLNITDCINF